MSHGHISSLLFEIKALPNLLSNENHRRLTFFITALGKQKHINQTLYTSFGLIVREIIQLYRPQTINTKTD